ncbi:hypothetical protein AX17_005088 [Amanita inopinata Kibby_2008]|nr:hypothetical protein AX17_005088 [Amanita inopinata Kibby_2008]
MRLDIATTVFAAFSLTVAIQAHEGGSFVGRKHHPKRVPKTDWNINPNSTALEARGGLEKRYDNAKFSFYDAGVSACGGTFSNSDFIVALNREQFAGGALCFQTITIEVEGKTTTAQIVDECMGCPFAGLDFSRGLFNFFAPESAGIIHGTWNVGRAPPPPPPPPPPPVVTHVIPALSPPPPTTSSTRLRTTSASVQATTTTPSATASGSTTVSGTTAAPAVTATGTIEEVNLLYVQLGSLLVQAPNV